jgi:chromosome segregation ATPase
MLPLQEKINQKQKETQTILNQVEQLEKEMMRIHTTLSTIKTHLEAHISQIAKEDTKIRELKETIENKTKEIEVISQLKNKSNQIILLHEILHSKLNHCCFIICYDREIFKKRLRFVLESK